VNMLLFAPLLFLASLAGAQEPIVQAGTGDWSQLPELERVSYDNLSSVVMMKMYEISKRHRCQLPGQRGNRLNMSISFAAEYAQQGQLSRLIIPQLNCPEAESWLGGVLLKSLKAGDMRPARGGSGWYRGSFSFYYEG